MKTQSRWCSVAVAIFCFVLASSVLQWLVDRDVGTSWPHNVLRNWQQYGIVALHGELVTNPGGVDALDHPIIYPGHRPMSLYPAYFVGALFAWTGSNFMAFHVVSALLVFLATWSLLGGDQRAFWVITLALLCPGYYIWPTVIDPNTVAALAGLPYAALLWWRMRQPTWAWSDLAFVFVLTLLFTALNKDTCELHHKLVPFDPALAQALSDRAVTILRATDARELLPRHTTNPDHFECRMCSWRERCWRLP